MGDLYVFVFCMVLWLVSPAAGWWAAAERNAGFRGAVAGLLFGPLGVIAALGFDNRDCCPRCGGRLNSLAPPISLCPYCRQRLRWEFGVARPARKPVAVAREMPVDAPPPPQPNETGPQYHDRKAVDVRAGFR